MFCPNCGTDHPSTTRFCGLCGTALAPSEPPVSTGVLTETQEPASAEYADSAPEPSRRQEETAIAGPSFLGLSDEPPERYNYLLEEEEEPRRGYVATYLVILVLLGAVIGGALKWRLIRDYLAGIRKAQPAISGEMKPAAADANPAQTDTSGQPQMTAEAARNPAAGAAPQPAPEPEAAPLTPPGATHDAALGAGPPPKYPPSALAEKAVANATENPAAAPDPAAKEPASPPAVNETEDEVATAPVRPKRSSAARSVPKPAEPDDRLLILGENYLYGRGVRRNCDQAVVYLKAAASARNPQAMGHLGAMYSTGQCVPLDRPTAYRWFTMAQQADPQNPWIERSRQMVWRQMSAAEQQRASGGTR